MQTTRLGTTGLTVSRLALGCMSYGDATAAGAHPWALDDDAAQPFFRQAVELGVRRSTRPSTNPSSTRYNGWPTSAA